MIDVEQIKQAAAGHWGDIICRLANVDSVFLDGKHGPCPKCEGVDRFRVFDDFEETGGMFCNQCFGTRNGDGIAALEWLTGWDFKTTLAALATELGIEASNGRVKQNGRTKSNGKVKLEDQFKVSSGLDVLIGKWVKHKPPCTLDAAKAAGAITVQWPRKSPCHHTAVAFPAFRSPLKGACGYILYRSDGKDFPAVGNLGQRKTHNVRGSQDGWIVVGGWDALKSAMTIWKCEGVPDALAIHPHLPDGHVVVTNICGCDVNWKKLPLSLFKDKRVNVVGDADGPGQSGAHKFAATVANKASDVRLVNLPFKVTPDHGKDLRDFFNENGQFEELDRLADEAEPVEAASDEASATPSFSSNTVSNGAQMGEIVHPLSMREIVSKIKRTTDDWPRRVGSALFVHEGDAIQWIDKTAAMFAYIGTKTDCPPRFFQETGCHTKAEVFEELRRTGTAYRAVETLPHEPPIEGHYYACDVPEPGDGKTLAALVERFNPATEIDAGLITTLFASTFWGGRGGTRPAFLITSAHGRGVGKTTLGAMAGYLADPEGHIELSANENAEIIKQRLLNPEGITKRVCMLDNVKTLRFSWAELESMITARVISGKKLYVGEARRPNVLTWIITLNGASLSTDMAQRCVIIELAKPKHTGGWLDVTQTFIDENRQELIADCIGFLRRDGVELSKYSRWGAWERDVLSRVPNPAEAQAVILERQGGVDVEEEEADILDDFFCQQLKSFDFSPDWDRVFIPSTVAARWFRWATNEKHSTSAVSRVLNQRIGENRLPRLQVNKCKTYGRGFIWIGEDWDGESTIYTDIECRISSQKYQLR